MANRTIDRKKAIAARSQSTRVGVKGGRSSVTDPAAEEEEQSNLQAGDVEVEEDEVAENEAFDDADEEDAEDAEESESEAEDEEESRALVEREERRVAKRERRERGVIAVDPQDYAISKPSGGSRLPDNTLVRFVRSSYRELRMVTWPTRQETWNWSLVVVGVCLVVAAVLGAADLGLSKFVEWWISLAH